MAKIEVPIILSAGAVQDMFRQTARQCFQDFLAGFDICTTHEVLGNGGIGEKENFQTFSHLQAPTIYDVAVRLAKEGWTYCDMTEDRAAPILTGPDGEHVRITREETRALMVYTPAKAGYWSQLIKRHAKAYEIAASQPVITMPGPGACKSTGT